MEIVALPRPLNAEIVVHPRPLYSAPDFAAVIRCPLDEESRCAVFLAHCNRRTQSSLADENLCAQVFLDIRPIASTQRYSRAVQVFDVLGIRQNEVEGVGR